MPYELTKWYRRHLKLSRVRSWVISLKSSSLNDEKTLRSLTRISTAFARSCLSRKAGKEHHYVQNSLSINKNFRSQTKNSNACRETITTTAFLNRTKAKIISPFILKMSLSHQFLLDFGISISGERLMILKLNHWQRSDWMQILKNSPIKSFQILLLPDFKEYLHRVPVIFNLCEPTQIPFNLIPFTSLDLIFKMLHIEEKTRLLLQPNI